MPHKWRWQQHPDPAPPACAKAEPGAVGKRALRVDIGECKDAKGKTITPIIVGQTVDFAHSLPKLWEQVSTYAQAHYPDWVAFGRKQMENPTVKQFVESVAAQVQELFGSVLPGVKAAFGQIRGAIGFLVGMALVPVYLFFFLRSTSDATAHRGLATPRNETMNMSATSATASRVANVMSLFDVSISSAERTGRPVSPASRPG